MRQKNIKITFLSFFSSLCQVFRQEQQEEKEVPNEPVSQIRTTMPNYIEMNSTNKAGHMDTEHHAFKKAKIFKKFPKFS
jgi:hypothetical protein